MKQNCQSCGLQAIPGARFCRQCGSPLFIETAESMAQTRHYRDRVGATSHPGYQTVVPPGEDTSRFYQHPQMPLYSVPAPQGSSSSFWLVMVLVGALTIAGVAGAIFTNLRADRRSADRDLARSIELSIHQQAEKQAAEIARQAEEAAKQAEIAAKQAEEAAKGIPVAPPPPPAPPAPPAITGVGPVIAGGSQLVYPKSDIETRKIAAGMEVIKLRTSDDLRAIERFYTQRLGNPPMVKRADSLIFNHRDETGNRVITVKRHPDDSDDFQIQIVKTP